LNGERTRCIGALAQAQWGRSNACPGDSQKTKNERFIEIRRDLHLYYFMDYVGDGPVRRVEGGLGGRLYDTRRATIYWLGSLTTCKKEVVHERYV
jgi:hypothetical protein